MSLISSRSFREFLSASTQVDQLGKVSLKSLAFKHPAEDDVLDHTKDVFHQVRVRRRRRKIVKVAGWTFVLLQILPLYIRAEIERFMKNMRKVGVDIFLQCWLKVIWSPIVGEIVGQYVAPQLLPEEVDLVEEDDEGGFLEED